MLLGELSSGDRQKIMTICTIDVHARDVVTSLIAQKVNMADIISVFILVQLNKLWNYENMLLNKCIA